jgi:hypothetical protein
MNNWASVKDGLPEVDVYVLIRQKYVKETMIARISQWGEWIEQAECLQVYGDASWDSVVCKVSSVDDYDSVTHWMPLPPPPAQEQ